MNYMPEVLKLLGVEVGEKFNVKGWKHNPHYFNGEYSVLNKLNHCIYDSDLVSLLQGNCKIEKPPWKPKEGEAYCIVTSDDGVVHTVWWGYSDDYYRYNAGNCFRTTEEITPEIKQRILKEMKGKYEGE